VNRRCTGPAPSPVGQVQRVRPSTCQAPGSPVRPSPTERGTHGSSDVDLNWQAFLRRFDLEHTFRMIKQTLGWTRPKLRTPEAADRWTWLVIAAHAQLRLTREAAADLRRPWEKPAEPARLTPARVRWGFRNLRPHLHCPARAPKPLTPGPGRPPGS
jgi:hypothetical protein